MEARMKMSSLLVAHSPLAGQPVPGKMQNVATISSGIDSDAMAGNGDSMSDFAGEEYWQWSDCRRIYSEPAASLLDSSRGSIASEGSGEESAIEDDVFSDCSDDEFEAISDKKVLDLNRCGWDEWTIPAADIQVHGVVSTNKRGERVCSGYWHGQVCMYARTAQTEEDIRSFAVEVNALCRIRHENIQLFMGVCLDLPQNSLGIVMSDLRGDSLNWHLHTMGHNFTTPSKLKILRQIAEGMEYLHAKGICHGVLSTHMITIHKRVCISVALNGTSLRKLDTNDLIYLPPEDIRALEEKEGEMILTTRPSCHGDIFAFGSIVYELVTLEKPFKNASLLNLIWQVGNGACQPLSLLPRGRFKGIISHCWYENPSKRPSFKEILSSVADNLLLPRGVFSPHCSSVPSELCTLGK